jgi:hypothetical protein
MRARERLNRALSTGAPRGEKMPPQTMRRVNTLAAIKEALRCGIHRVSRRVATESSQSIQPSGVRRSQAKIPPARMVTITGSV